MDLKIIEKPKNSREAATRFAVIVFFGQEQIPTLAELSEWSGLPPEIALKALRTWHPELARILAGETH